MRKIYLFFFICFFSLLVQAQIPQSFNYQAIARDLSGVEIPNQNIGVQVNILDSLNVAIYTETHSPTTNQFGLFDLQIGQGTPVLGTFSTVNWLSGKISINLKLDLTGGTNYVDFGTSLLQSVPYALTAQEAVKVKMGIGGLTDVDTTGKTTDQILKWDGTKWKMAADNSDSQWVRDSVAGVVYNLNHKIGVGTALPGVKMEVSGAEANNTPGAGVNAAFKITNTNTGAVGRLAELHFGVNPASKYAAISGFLSDGTANTRGDILFSTRNLPGDVDLTERMRVDGSGNVRISGLAGSGTRMVTSDINGTLGSQAIPVVPAKVFKVTGTVGDGITDDTQAIQAVLNTAANDPGCIVFLPDGIYAINGTLFVPAGVTLMGTYEGPGNRPGTTLNATGYAGSATGNGCVVLNFGIAAIKGIKIFYPNQVATAASPILYPYAIKGFHSCRIEEVYLHNAYQGINLDEAHANLVRNVWGNPLAVGINVDHCLDVSRIENVHFWPYFTNGQALEAWVAANGIAMQFGRDDWQYCSNTFVYGYKTGFRFYNQPNISATEGLPGGATNGHFTGCGVDKGSVCVDVENCIPQGVSFTDCMFASFGANAGRAIVLRSTNSGNISFTNCNFFANPSSIAEILAGNLSFNACNFDNWAQTQTSQSCFIQTGGGLSVSGCMFNRGGAVLNTTGASSKATMVANMSSTLLTVSSTIGTRLVKFANNPDF